MGMKSFGYVLTTAVLSTPASAFVRSPSSSANSRPLSMAGADNDVAPMPNPNPVIKLAANGMSLLKPIFALEANLQAAALGAIGNVDKEAVAADIANLKAENKVLIYTYGLSPFSSEAVSMLDATGCEYTNIELGKERKRASRCRKKWMGVQPACPRFLLAESVLEDAPSWRILLKAANWTERYRVSWESRK